MKDLFSSHSVGLTAPVSEAAAVVPADDADLPFASRVLFVGSGGDLRVTLTGGRIVILRNLAAGWHPLRVARIWATGTTATDIVAGW